jgi:hypothetical protein
MRVRGCFSLNEYALPAMVTQKLATAGKDAWSSAEDPKRKPDKADSDVR